MPKSGDGRDVSKQTKRVSKYSSSTKGTVTKTGGYGPIEQSDIRYDPDEVDREELGLKSLELYVDKMPEHCAECIWYVKNVNYDKLINPEESVFYCSLRAALNTAQYGGINIAVPKTYICPLTPIQKSKKFLKLRNTHLERIKELEQAVFGEDKGDDGVLDDEEE
jgi:hypothetical protein